MSDHNNVLMASILGAGFLGTVLFADKIFNNESNKEHFGAVEMSKGYQGNNYVSAQGTRLGAPQYPQYPQANQFYGNAQRPASSNMPYAGPNGALPQALSNVNLNTSGDQLLSYQLYQQAVNASTPTLQQLNSISGNSQQQTGVSAEQLQGGLSQDYAPYNNLGGSGPMLYDSEYQAVNLGNGRAESISACAQNAPTFVATSLLPKPSIPGQESWEIDAPQDILANQNFLSSIQQIGVDTVMSSHRNASRDLRNSIPNPINVVSPWNNTSLLPDLERKNLDCYIPEGGIYGCPTGANTNGTYIGM